jgi:hypothetical protein
MMGLDPDSELMRAATRMGRWMDPRQARELTDEQKASVDVEEELIQAIEKRDSLALELQQSPSKKKDDQGSRYCALQAYLKFFSSCHPLPPTKIIHH